MTTRLLAGLLALAVGATGCAPRYRSVTIGASTPAADTNARSRGDASAQDAWRRLARQLPPAAVVRLQLADGTRFRGVVLVVEDDAMIVKPKTRIPEPQRRVAYATIESLEIDTGRGIGAAKAAAIGIGTGAATFVTLILLTFAILDD